MAEPNWRKIVDNLLERLSTVTLEHAAMKSLASDLETQRNELQAALEGAGASVDPNTNGHGHGHGHGETVEYRVASPE